MFIIYNIIGWILFRQVVRFLTFLQRAAHRHVASGYVTYGLLNEVLMFPESNVLRQVLCSIFQFVLKVYPRRNDCVSEKVLSSRGQHARGGSTSMVLPLRTFISAQYCTVTWPSKSLLGMWDSNDELSESCILR